VETRSADPAAIAADAQFHLLFEGESELDPQLADLDRRVDGAIKEMVDTGEARGKLHEATVIHSGARTSARRILLLGAGKRASLTPEGLGRLYGQAAREADRRGWAILAAGSTAIEGPVLSADGVRAAVTGAVTALARGDLYKTGDRPASRLEKLILATRERT